MFEQLGLIGCGLMGGSFALAMKKAGLVKRVVGYSKSPTTTERALSLGVIDVEAPSALLAVSGADVVLLAVPVSATESVLKAVRHMVDPSKVLLMDVGSTKADVVVAAQSVLKRDVSCFVPAHPIAGKEVSGVEHAEPDLFANRKVILTPTRHTAVDQVEKATAVWTGLGATVAKMTPASHDAAFAAVSHLPHMIAFALMNSIMMQESPSDLLSLAGPGFRDFSRIAASDPKMWADIFIANKDSLLLQSYNLKQQLEVIESLLRSGDMQELQAAIGRASKARQTWQMNNY